MKIDEDLDRVIGINDDYNKGKPEPAIDNAGDILDIAMLALDVLKKHPEAVVEYERRRVA